MPDFEIFHCSVMKPEHLAISLNLRQLFLFYSYFAE